jgi:hypothetical protein
MFTKDYEWYIRHLTEHAGMSFSEVLFVDNIASWCRRHGIDEADEHRPLKIVTGKGVTLLIAKMIPDQILEERINATRIRSQLKSVSHDRADLLNSPEKKLAYLFLKELSLSNPDLAYDDLAADEWIFGELDRIGITNPEIMKSA